MRIVELEKLVSVPGMWRCSECGFHLIQSNLNACNGTVTARDDPGDSANDGAPLWRVTEREILAQCDELLDRVSELERVQG